MTANRHHIGCALRACLLSFAVGALPSSASGQSNVAIFGAAAQFPTGDTPMSVVFGNFSPAFDCRTDMAVANLDANTVTILFGDGKGGVSSKTNISSFRFSSPIALAVLDFDKDGFPDLAVANLASDEVKVLLGRGDGTFSREVTFNVGNRPVSLATADFDGDGNPDLAVANRDSHSVTIRYGNGAGGSARNEVVALDPTKFPTALVAATLPATQFRYLAVLNRASAPGRDEVTILHHGGAPPRFTIAQSFPVTTGSTSILPTSLAAADFDFDDFPDLAVANRAATDVTILTKLATTTPTTTQVPAVAGLGSVAVADVNADGVLDLALANVTNGTTTILLGNGAGGFNPPAMGAIVPASGVSPSCVAFGDLDLDGKRDLVVANGSSGGIAVRRNQTNQGAQTVTFTEWNLPPEAGTTPAAFVIDRNGVLGTPSPRGTVWYVTAGDSTQPPTLVRLKPGNPPESGTAEWKAWDLGNVRAVGGVKISNEDLVYINTEDAILRIDPSNDQLVRWPEPGVGSVSEIALSQTGDVFTVIDPGDGVQIQGLDPEASIITRWRVPSLLMNPHVRPLHGIAVQPVTRLLYFADRENSAIGEFDPATTQFVGGSLGFLVRYWPMPASDYVSPERMCTDGFGAVWVNTAIQGDGAPRAVRLSGRRVENPITGEVTAELTGYRLVTGKTGSTPDPLGICAGDTHVGLTNVLGRLGLIQVLGDPLPPSVPPARTAPLVEFLDLSNPMEVASRPTFRSDATLTNLRIRAGTVVPSCPRVEPINGPRFGLSSGIVREVPLADGANPRSIDGDLAGAFFYPGLGSANAVVRLSQNARVTRTGPVSYGTRSTIPGASYIGYDVKVENVRGRLAGAQFSVIVDGLSSPDLLLNREGVTLQSPPLNAPFVTLKRASGLSLTELTPEDGPVTVRLKFSKNPQPFSLRLVVGVGP
jgi:hypothetical protein